jgi:hypothetical protein
VRWFVFVSIALLAPTIAAQPLSGTYSCANGNPGNAFDYADVGDFFDDLETHGMGGAVILELHDSGGPFQSRLSYMLGADHNPSGQFPTLRAVAGLSSVSSLTIRAASGNAPEIVGSGPPLVNSVYNKTGALYFLGIAHCTIDGLTIRDTDYFGIAWEDHGMAPRNESICIRNCRIYNVSEGAALFSFRFEDNITIENNVCWNCKSYGKVYSGTTPPTVIIRPHGRPRADDPGSRDWRARRRATGSRVRFG